MSDKHVALNFDLRDSGCGHRCDHTHKVWFTSADLDLARYVCQLKVERGREGGREGRRE